jgi:hypothetical protein
MKKVIIYKLKDGGVAIVSPSPNWTGTLEELAAKDIPANTPYKIIDASELPSDRTFRNAWRWQD